MLLRLVILSYLWYDKIMKQLVFIDDSGDPGFAQGVSSTRLMMAGAVFIDPEEATKLNDEISKLRKDLGWHDNHEFKFRKASKEVKIRFLNTANQYHFNIYAVYIDKTRFHKNILQFASDKHLYNWTAKELLKIMPLDKAYVKIDGRASRMHKLRVAAYLRREINADGYKIKEIKTQDSVHDNLIQLADMIVGSIGRSFQTDKTDAKTYMNIIKNKIIEIKSLDL